MSNLLISLCQVANYLIHTKPALKKAQKYEKAGDLKSRDELTAVEVSSWARYMVEITGSTVNVTGSENVPQNGAVVFIANHQSYMDIPVLLGYINKHKAFIAKIEILKVPILSKWMQMMQCTFLKRGNMHQSLKAMHEAVDNVKNGYSLVIFPEGTRSWGGPVKEFKPGSFKLAFQAGVPIVPVSIDGTWRLFEYHKKLEKGDINITIHPAVSTKGLTKDELHALVPQIQKSIESVLPPPREVPMKNGKPTKTPKALPAPKQ